MLQVLLLKCPARPPRGLSHLTPRHPTLTLEQYTLWEAPTPSRTPTLRSVSPLVHLQTAATYPINLLPSEVVQHNLFIILFLLICCACRTVLNSKYKSNMLKCWFHEPNWKIPDISQTVSYLLVPSHNSLNLAQYLAVTSHSSMVSAGNRGGQG